MSLLVWSILMFGVAIYIMEKSIKRHNTIRRIKEMDKKVSDQKLKNSQKG